jgi:hypothetical protein
MISADAEGELCAVVPGQRVDGGVVAGGVEDYVDVVSLAIATKDLELVGAEEVAHA